MNRNPNWTEEEIKLALELYLSHDLQWLARISDSTFEIDDELFLFSDIKTSSFLSGSNSSLFEENNGEYWAAFLGLGGYILDDMNYYPDLSDDLYLAPSYEFCEEYYNHDGWEYC